MTFKEKQKTNSLFMRGREKDKKNKPKKNTDQMKLYLPNLYTHSTHKKSKMCIAIRKYKTRETVNVQPNSIQFTQY